MRKTIEKTGVVAELDGKYWGCQFADGQITNDDFGPIEKARIENPQYCKHPEDLVHADHHYWSRLKEATLRKITVITTYEIGE